MAKAAKKYAINYSPAAGRDLKGLKRNKVVLESIDRTILALANNPRPAGAEQLSGSNNFWKKRDGGYRILYEIDDAKSEVTIQRVRDRKDVYRN